MYCDGCYRKIKSGCEFRQTERLTDWIQTPDGCETRFLYHEDVHAAQDFERENTTVGASQSRLGGVVQGEIAQLDVFDAPISDALGAVCIPAE